MSCVVFGCSGLIGRKWFFENLLFEMKNLLFGFLVLFIEVKLWFGW